MIGAAPSANWHYGVPAGLARLALVPLSRPVGGAGVTTIAAAGLLAGWFLLPLATYPDVRYVRAETEWNPITGWWLLGAVVLPLAVVSPYLSMRFLAGLSLGHDGTDGAGETE